jgi:hypothetical protein
MDIVLTDHELVLSPTKVYTYSNGNVFEQIKRKTVVEATVFLGVPRPIYYRSAHAENFKRNTTVHHIDDMISLYSQRTRVYRHPSHDHR